MSSSKTTTAPGERRGVHVYVYVYVHVYVHVRVHVRHLERGEGQGPEGRGWQMSRYRNRHGGSSPVHIHAHIHIHIRARGWQMSRCRNRHGGSSPVRTCARKCVCVYACKHAWLDGCIQGHAQSSQVYVSSASLTLRRMCGAGVWCAVCICLHVYVSSASLTLRRCVARKRGSVSLNQPTCHRTPAPHTRRNVRDALDTYTCKHIHTAHHTPVPHHTARVGVHECM